MASPRGTFPDTVHTILKTALGAAEPEDRTAPPWHLGGPRPVCPAREQIGLALTFARLFEHRVHSANRRAFESTLAAVDRYLEGNDDGRSLRALADQKSGKDLAYGIACNAAGSSATLARGKPDLVNSGAQAAAAKAVALAPPGPRRTALLSALDQQIMRAECEAAFAHARHPQVVERVLWRGGELKAIHWVARVEGGRCAALVKLVPRRPSTWAEGSLEDVVAVVPAEVFGVAVETVVREFAKPTEWLSALAT